jgi:hypothetical protein
MKTAYTIDFKYNLILGAILAVYVKINSTTVALTCAGHNTVSDRALGATLREAL